MVKRKLKASKTALLECGIAEDFHHIRLSDYTGPRLWRDRVDKYIGELDKMRKTGVSFLFWGRNNAGKTTLAMILAKAYFINGYSVTVTSLREMTDRYCGGWSEDSDQYYFSSRIKNCDFLVVDDLSKEFKNRMTGAVLDEVLRHRSNHLLPFALTTNSSPDELLQEYGPSFYALIDRRAVVGEFKKSIANAQTLVDRNLEILNGLGGSDA